MTLLGSVESRKDGKTYYWLKPDIQDVNTGLGYKTQYQAQRVAQKKAKKLGYTIRWERGKSEKR